MILYSCTFLDSRIDINDTRINVNGYLLMRADHPSNTKSGYVCMYYKIYLSIIRGIDISDLQERILTKTTVDKKRCSLTCLYSSPSQNEDKLETFCSNLTSYSC